jgi:hypothetical protein
METASKEVMKTTIFYSALLFLLIASLTGLAVATALRPYTGVAPGPSRSLELPAPAVPAS